MMITTLLEIGLSNAVVASLIALVAFVVTKRMRPQWALAIWLLVLAKLLMPPLWTVPLASLRAPVPGEEPAEFISWNQTEQPVAFSTEASVVVPETQFEPLPITEAVVEPPARTVSFPALLLAAWGFGTVCWSILAVRRIHGFRTLLKHTRVAPRTMQAEIDALAAEIGLRRAPALRITRRRIAPLVWAFSRRTTILLPAALVEQLSSEERKALLLHELTHLRRRDYLAKLLELAAVAVYWWLPTAWWARRQADRATEGCCDAEVVTRLSGVARSYASALVKTIDYLSEATQPLPLGASGFSQFGLVSRRIEMILEPLPLGRVTWKSRLAIVALCLLVLPVSVRSLWAESPPVTEEAAASSVADPSDSEEELNFPPELESLWKLRASKILDLDNLERAKGERAKLESPADDEVKRLVQTRDALRKQWSTLKDAYDSGKVGIDGLLTAQKELVYAEMAVTRDVFPQTPVGRELRTLCDFAANTEAMLSAKELYWQAYFRGLKADWPTADDQKAKEQFNYFKQQYVELINQVYSRSAFESNAETLRFMLEELEKQGIAATDRKVYAIQGNPPSRNKYLDPPPSDDEILIVLRGKCRDEQCPLPVKHFRIKKSRIGDYTDPPVKNYPVTGQAYTSHTFYKCTVDYQGTDGQDHHDEFYVDHHHQHRPTHTPARTTTEREESVGWDPRLETLLVGENSPERVLAELTRLESAADASIRTQVARRDALLQQVDEMEKALEKGTADLDDLIQRQRELEATRTALARDVCPDTDEGRALLVRAKLCIATGTQNRARRIWQKIYARSRIGAPGGEHESEAQAREYFYDCKSQWQTALNAAISELSANEEFQKSKPTLGGRFKSEQDRRVSWNANSSPEQEQLENAQPAPPSKSNGNPAHANAEPQPTRSMLGNQQQSSASEKEFQAEVNRVPIVGPITSGDKVAPLDPPSDDEVLRAFIKVSGEHRPLPGKSHRIVKELVATYTAPPRMLPLIGKAEMHHAHYKCKFYYDDTHGKPQEKVLYVDHNHLHQKVDSRSFDEFQSGSLRYHLPRGFTKQVAQFRHYQLQLAREKARLADLTREIVGAPTPEQQAEFSRLEMRIAARQQELDAAAGILLRSALSPVVPLSGTSYWVGQER